MTAPAAKRRFTIEEYHRLEQAGILSEDERVELLDGEIVEMSPIGSKHGGCVNWLAEVFFSRLQGRAIVTVQNPITLGQHSEPQPDLAILRPRADYYRGAHPVPAEVLLVIEIADTTGERDRRIKIPLYAKGGIPEVWLVVLKDSLVERYQAPAPDRYRSVERRFPNDTIAPEAFPDLKLSVAAILG